LFREPWFEETFGANYDDKSPAPFVRWLDGQTHSPESLLRAWEQQRMAQYLFETKEGKKDLARDFATPYAVVNASPHRRTVPNELEHRFHESSPPA
jgi:hypothetical protein